jgi:hypothetical protein
LFLIGTELHLLVRITHFFRAYLPLSPSSWYRTGFQREGRTTTVLRRRLARKRRHRWQELRLSLMLI